MKRYLIQVDSESVNVFARQNEPIINELHTENQAIFIFFNNNANAFYAYFKLKNLELHKKQISHTLMEAYNTYIDSASLTTFFAQFNNAEALPNDLAEHLKTYYRLFTQNKEITLLNWEKEHNLVRKHCREIFEETLDLEDQYLKSQNTNEIDFSKIMKEIQQLKPTSYDFFQESEEEKQVIRNFINKITYLEKNKEKITYFQITYYASTKSNYKGQVKYVNNIQELLNTIYGISTNEPSPECTKTKGLNPTSF